MTTYREAGVDIDASDETLRRIKPLVRRTFTEGVLTDIGSFGAFFQPDFSRFEEPVLVSSVDGVGTKLKVAFLAEIHDTVGQDLVNHCVNDIAVCGAVPLFFLDYFSTGKLYPDIAEQIISGFSTACAENGCALIGGETAEMPDLYRKGEYDLAGTIVGVVDKDRIVDGRAIESGDILIGIPSTGLHTNGFSLARKVLFDRFAIDDCPAEFGGRSIGDELLQIHRSYLHLIQSLLNSNDSVRGLVHVTGGGIPGNTRRIIPAGLDISVEYDAWERPAVYRLIQELGGVPESDMRRTFNLGIGLIIVARKADSDQIMETCLKEGEKPILIGKVRNV